MKLISKFFRNEEQCKVESVETWEVRWLSRYGDFSGDTEPQVMVFPSKLDAERFKAALVDAFKLVRNTSEGRSVQISKSEV